MDEELSVVNVRSREKTNQLKIYLNKSKDYCKIEVKKVHYLNFYFVPFRLVPKASASSVEISVELSTIIESIIEYNDNQ